MTDALYSLSEEIGRVLRERQQKLVTAESCTGGWVAKCITDVAGSSQWFDRGFVTYSNEAKVGLLGLSDSLLVEYGAVSCETVQKNGFWSSCKQRCTDCDGSQRNCRTRRWYRTEAGGDSLVRLATDGKTLSNGSVSFDWRPGHHPRANG